MAVEQQIKEGEPENLRKQLAFAVKNIQWSYAIFWSISSRQPGELEWDDGFYNGDIKTRKTVQAVQLDANQLGLQRTEQLRELYGSLSGVETNPQAKRPSVALSPEDLTDTEWYFLVCMSFVFNIGEGLPGKTLANNQSIWLCNAQYADSKVFSRSLLAKSASIQTVVCFPYSGGVIELGTTDLVLENPSIIQHIITSFLETSCTIVSGVSENARNDKDFDCIKLDQDILDINHNQDIELEEVNIGSTNNCSNGFEPNHQATESLLVEGINNGGSSQVQSWHFIDDEISDCVHNSFNSSDSVSQIVASPENITSFLKENKVNDDHLLYVEECKDMAPTSIDFQNDGIHYQSILSTILKSSNQLIMGPYFQNSNKKSGFVSWKKGVLLGSQKSRTGASQRLLKKVIFEVARMHGSYSLELQEDNGQGEDLWKPEADDIEAEIVVAERRPRGKINERFDILGSMVPSTGKVDKVSILDDTILYLKNLQNRIEELESQMEVPEIETQRRAKPRDFVERTSDNYGDKRNCNNKKRVMKKRKARDLDEMKAVNNKVQLEDNLVDDVTVSMTGKNVLIKVKCPWREGLLLEIMDAVSILHLDSHSVQSSNTDGNLSLTVKSKVKGSAVASVRMIREALQRVTSKC